MTSFGTNCGNVPVLKFTSACHVVALVEQRALIFLLLKMMLTQILPPAVTVGCSLLNMVLGVERQEFTHVRTLCHLSALQTLK